MPGSLPNTVFPLVGQSPQGLAIADAGLELRELATLVCMHAFCVSGGVALSPPELIGRRAVEIADATLAALSAPKIGRASPVVPPVASERD